MTGAVHRIMRSLSIRRLPITAAGISIAALGMLIVGNSLRRDQIAFDAEQRLPGPAMTGALREARVGAR